jgi:two-component system chemotaxis sensor kinase CheA
MRDAEKILQAFREEANEIADELSQLVASLRSGDDAEARTEVLSDARRITHNLKGAAASVGHAAVEGLCHEIEDELAKLGSGAIDDQVQEALEALVAAVEEQASAGFESRLDDHFVAGPEGNIDTIVKVSAQRLDELMSQVGELLVTHSRLAARTGTLLELHRQLDALVSQAGSLPRGFDGLARSLEHLAQKDRRDLLDFEHLTEEMGDVVRGVRMVPLATLAPSWRRLARDTAVATGKRVDLAVSVGSLEIDKSLLDAVRDPLLHLVRNAIDHGIEEPERRQEIGKPAHGRVEIRAEMRGSMVGLEVSDDGGGIDVSRIADAALERGLIDESQRKRLEPEDTLTLLLRPGFSTASSVSRISGRGVGLDAVREQVASVGGTLRIVEQARLGGATFEILVPATVLSTRQLLVRTGEGLYAVPMERVNRAVTVIRSEVKTADGVPVVLVDGGEPLRFANLSAVVGERGSSLGEQIKVLVISNGGREIGLGVEEIVGEGEYVTKPLPWNVERTVAVNGAIILADGSLALVLDVAGLMLDALTGQPPSAVADSDYTRKPVRILVVDDSLSSRTLARNMLAAAGYEVSVRAEGLSAWDALEQGGFDLLVSDIKMPGIDGLELTRRIRRHSRLAHMPIILVTGLGSPDQVAQGAEAGADEYLVKGQFDQSALLEAVSRLV